MTLHRSHYRWPGSSDQRSGISDQNIPITEAQPRSKSRPMVRLAAQPKDLCFTCPRRIAVKPPVTDAPLPRPGPDEPKAAKRETPSGSTAPRRLAARSPMIGHIHSSRCRITSSRSREHARPEGERCAGRAQGLDGEFLWCGPRLPEHPRSDRPVPPRL